ncbi:MAG TPA: DNA repair exonuclease [Paenibacillus sp.]|uniref:metallophosphoesterase family protein n=1 Tax=Paenibacillus sp. TaxID=58172 RepID=UPI002CFEA9BD|nr:DNA repair exonuclease [Paenibacillus sp.]HUC93505.1 DNA repair exonuclease [Paenibacillus sp.]
MSVPFRFIHAADLHLDSPFKGLGEAPPAVRQALADSTFEALRRLTAAAVSAKADFVLLAGDLFDAADRSLRAQAVLHQQWAKLREHGIGVYVIHGNHDPLSGQRARFAEMEGVHVFGAEQYEGRPAYRKDGELAAFVYGMSYARRAVTDNLAARYRPAAAAPFHIALLHGNVDGDPSHDPYAPCTLGELAGAGFDYWALGHVHDRRVLHTYPHVVYSGNTQGRHPRETGAKGCYIVDVAADKAVELTFAPLDAVRWTAIQVEIAGVREEAALLDRLEAACDRAAAEAEDRPLMAALTLTGAGPLHARLTEASYRVDLLHALRERSAASGRDPEANEAWLWVYNLEAGTMPETDLARLAGEDSFAGELYRLARRIAADPEESRTLAAEAMAPMNDHPQLRRLLREWRLTGEEELVSRAALRLAGMLATEEESE